MATHPTSLRSTFSPFVLLRPIARQIGGTASLDRLLYSKHLHKSAPWRRTQMPNFNSVETPSGVARLRDLTTADIPAIVDYWLSMPEESLAFMGVDRQRLGSHDEIHRRFSNAIRSGDANQPNIALAITLDDRLVGYTLLNRYSAEVNYSHWHIIVPTLRAKGLSTALYPLRIQAYFEMAPIAQLIHQTRTRNVAVNRMLDKFVPVAETKHIEKPDGVASPGEFHIRYVRREDFPAILARAANLGAVPRP
jgi:RimJ/RimL family protein N-acetyltransferase